MQCCEVKDERVIAGNARSERASFEGDEHGRVPVVFRTGESCALLAAGNVLDPRLSKYEVAATGVRRLKQDGVVGVLGDGGIAGTAVPGPGSCQRVLLPLRNRAGRGDRLSFDRSGPAVGAACGVDGHTYQSTDLEDLHVNDVASGANGHGDRSRLTDTVADVPHFHLAVRIRVGDIAIRGLPGLVVVVRYRQCGSSETGRDTNHDQGVACRGREWIGEGQRSLAGLEFIRGLYRAHGSADSLHQAKVNGGGAARSDGDIRLGGTLVAGSGGGHAVGTWSDTQRVAPGSIGGCGRGSAAIGDCGPGNCRAGRVSDCAGDSTN